MGLGRGVKFKVVFVQVHIYGSQQSCSRDPQFKAKTKILEYSGHNRPTVQLAQMLCMCPFSSFCAKRGKLASGEARKSEKLSGQCFLKELKTTRKNSANLSQKTLQKIPYLGNASSLGMTFFNIVLYFRAAYTLQ